MITLEDLELWTKYNTWDPAKVKELILRIKSLEDQLGNLATTNLEAQHRAAVRATKLKAKIEEARDLIKSLRTDYRNLPASLQYIDDTIISLEEVL
jgi:predicted RNase H-like nuclease (RuvC/YqgF family)